MSSLVESIKQVLFVQPEEIEKLPDADVPCPVCRQHSLKTDKGFLITIHRCTNCRFEGSTR